MLCCLLVVKSSVLNESFYSLCFQGYLFSVFGCFVLCWYPCSWLGYGWGPSLGLRRFRENLCTTCTTTIDVHMGGFIIFRRGRRWTLYHLFDPSCLPVSRASFQTSRTLGHALDRSNVAPDELLTTRGVCCVTPNGWWARNLIVVGQPLTAQRIPKTGRGRVTSWGCGYFISVAHSAWRTSDHSFHVWWICCLALFLFEHHHILCIIGAGAESVGVGRRRQS